MKAIVIKGNKKYIDNARARGYYQEISDFLESLGVTVEFDDGLDYTCPGTADFYIAHSKGCSRLRCFEGSPKEKDFLMFGDPDGYIHPVDAKWQKENPPKESRFNPPPKEHFEFIESQKNAIRLKVEELKRKEVNLNRQSPSRKPSVKRD